MTIVYAILAFCVMIFVHELGHFLVAKACKMRVDEFSLGMGPRILKHRGKETMYSLKLLPIGGSVQLGEDEETDDPRSFRNKPVWQRMLVMVAGAVMNLILGFVICVICVMMSSGVSTSVVGGFYDNSNSSAALQEGDKIVAVNGLSIWSTTDISYALSNSVANKTDNNDYVTYDFVVIRDGQTVELPDVRFATRQAADGSESIYLDFFVIGEQKNFFNVISSSFNNACSYGRLVIMSLFDLIKGTYGLNDLSGPIGVVQTMSQVASIDIKSLLSMIALITINLGIFNLLPIPALDGGRFVFLIIELIRRKPIKAEIEGMIHFVGFAALMLLMLVVTFNDVVKLVTGG